jgi:hypothetical protein
VALDRRLLLLTLIAGLLFLWPLLVYGRPGDFQDSAAYYKGGQAAVSFALEKIHLQDRAPPENPIAVAPVPALTRGAAEPSAQDPQQIRGVRSVAYSLAAYVLGAPRPQMWLLVAAQAFATGFICAVALLLFGDGLRTASAKLAALAVATPVAFVSCVILPDVFAGVVILAVALLAIAYRFLSPGVRITSILIGTGGITFHASHLPIGFGVTAVAAALLYVNMRGTSPALRGQWASLAAPFLLAAALTVLLNSVAFGGPSLTGKRFPLTLARSVAEGPGKWYLDRNCPHLKYAICEVYPNGVPSTVDSFLWGENGVKKRATPEQLDRIRAEESEIVLAAARAYPVQELGRLAHNFGKQLVRFQPGIGLDAKIVVDADAKPVSVPARYDPTPVRIVGALSITSVLASLVFLVIRWRTIVLLRPIIVVVVSGILLNAAICVYFSGINERYQARVIWLIPLLALMALRQGERHVAKTLAYSQE